MAETASVEVLSEWIREFARVVAATKDQLNALDAAIGDGDHGTNLDRGLAVAVSVLDANPAGIVGTLFDQLGQTVINKTGGATGPLFGTFFRRLGAAVGDTQDLNSAGLAAGLRAGLEGVVARGRAEAGDKTMYDALAPAVYALPAEGDLCVQLRTAFAAAESGCHATIPMLARKGRASYLGERSVGHQDPGATSVVLLFQAAARVMC
ncbi:dihydroxyacetone kinase subunit DhaL [Kribbella sp. NBC_01245]|uniref:dihydroxyacetone kinase subunit DhaL n=1 Tax=Kribbella sp. NBC_01245 TaxID=2903578 RepID=UPI002E28EE6A|nr:dihydroxyacetone kinase subunit DhaL [Kribbella sp. NBC_01245]